MSPQWAEPASARSPSETEQLRCPPWLRDASISSQATTLASSQQHYAEPGQTLIFFDWDDTLFPTTELFERRQVPKNRDALHKPLPQGIEEALPQWRDALFQYLCVACSLSEHCVIVTNSTRPWVEDCINRFVPALRQLLVCQAHLHVVYASEALESSRVAARSWSREGKQAASSPSSPMTAAKLAAMHREATCFYDRYPEQTWKNIISLGDMKYEHDALQELARRRPSPCQERLRAKAIILPGSPTLSELALRLQFSRLLLPAYVRFDGDIDLDLRSAPDPLQAIAQALDMPRLAELPFPRHAWGRTPVPEEEVAVEALDELALAVHDCLFDSIGTGTPEFLTSRAAQSAFGGRRSGAPWSHTQAGVVPAPPLLAKLLLCPSRRSRSTRSGRANAELRMLSRTLRLGVLLTTAAVACGLWCWFLARSRTGALQVFLSGVACVLNVICVLKVLLACMKVWQALQRADVLTEPIT